METVKKNLSEARKLCQEWENKKERLSIRRQEFMGRLDVTKRGTAEAEQRRVDYLKDLGRGMSTEEQLDDLNAAISKCREDDKALAEIIELLDAEIIAHDKKRISIFQAPEEAKLACLRRKQELLIQRIQPSKELFAQLFVTSHKCGNRRLFDAINNLFRDSNLFAGAPPDDPTEEASITAAMEKEWSS